MYSLTSVPFFILKYVKYKVSLLPTMIPLIPLIPTYKYNFISEDDASYNSTVVNTGGTNLFEVRRGEVTGSRINAPKQKTWNSLESWLTDVNTSGEVLLDGTILILKVVKTYSEFGTERFTKLVPVMNERDKIIQMIGIYISANVRARNSRIKMEILSNLIDYLLVPQVLDFVKSSPKFASVTTDKFIELSKNIRASPEFEAKCLHYVEVMKSHKSSITKETAPKLIISESEANEDKTTTPETATPETATPETVMQETAAPETATPETTTPETTPTPAPETTTPEETVIPMDYETYGEVVKATIDNIEEADLAAYKCLPDLYVYERLELFDFLARKDVLALLKVDHLERIYIRSVIRSMISKTDEKSAVAEAGQKLLRIIV